MKTELHPMGPAASGTAKQLGAYYTDTIVARFLTRWAVRQPSDAILDPSAGAGVFLEAAAARLAELGQENARGVRGVEIDPETHRRSSSALFERFGLEPENVLLSDFFAVRPERFGEVDAIIGNPPFIRYQRFTGDARKRALTCAVRQGVRLSELCSSWAPFLIHSVAFIKTGGRLAMVIPNELTHASYAKPVLRFLVQHFAKVSFLTFRKKLFPQLSEDTILLLADNKGAVQGTFVNIQLESAEELANLDLDFSSRQFDIDSKKLLAGEERLAHYSLSEQVRSLYRELAIHPEILRLGDLADVGIGYVSGANDFFHLSAAQVESHAIPQEFVRRAVRRGKAFSGVRFTQSDWEQASQIGDADYLLALPPNEALPNTVKRYITAGERKEIHKRYKCRVRSPWYCVPHVYQADAFLTYMSGEQPRLVVNDCKAVAPNTLHVVRLRETAATSALELAATWYSSLTRLSTEMEGHPLGGGMLKLEPREARAILLPLPKGVKVLDGLLEELDETLRSGKLTIAQQLVDDKILIGRLGLSKVDCRRLREAAVDLRNRRCNRSVHGPTGSRQSSGKV